MGLETDRNGYICELAAGIGGGGLEFGFQSFLIPCLPDFGECEFKLNLD
jgi:hypothetical protein